MTQTWLHPNRRVLCLSLPIPALLGAAGVVLLVWPPGGSFLLRLLGGIVAGLAAGAVVSLMWQMRQPRVGYRNGRLLVAVARGAPLEVPIELVECFLLGEAPAGPRGTRLAHRPGTALVIRLAERATQYHQRETLPALGTWCGGYITLRGTWCEPLDIPLVQRLNQRLAEVRQQAVSNPSDGSP
jgi:hypothetical protein